MVDNIFFDVSKLKKIGKNVIIGKTVRMRYPELVEIGDNCIIDDFTYISTGLKLGRNVHISAGSQIIGGSSVTVSIGDFCGVSAHCMLIAGSDDFMNGMNGSNIPKQYHGNMRFGNIVMEKHSMLAPYAMIMPGVTVAEGTVIDSYSRVKRNTKPWYLYVGNPAKPIMPRNRETIVQYEQRFFEDNAL